MLPAIAILVACYTLTRFVEMIAAHSEPGGNTFVRGVAVVAAILSFGSCSVATFGG